MKDVDLFRINLSHVSKLEETIKYIQERVDTPVALDTDSGKYKTDDDQRGSYNLVISDLRGIEIGLKYGIRITMLSFTERAAQVAELKAQFPLLQVRAKIETKEGISNAHEISLVSNGLLLDRGDLSRQIHVTRVPAIQRRMLRDFSNVFVATNMMQSMMSSTIPSTGEANDVYSTLVSGAKGIVLAGETAIGLYPIETVQVVKDIIDVYLEQCSEK
jgi:pyruvate kinase